ncbi:uncharacterized protein LOC135156780 [Lytechinus pictus]|uniref:uncharacterized protein LOC135156780 n=1 Tax=Lytechinus pictus TaxID=7653 RepID=UPI0030B9B17B
MSTQHRETYPNDRENDENKISMKGPGFCLEIDPSRLTNISFSYLNQNGIKKQIVLDIRDEKEVLTVGVQPQDERNIEVGLGAALESSGSETRDEEMSEIGPLRSDEGRQVSLGLPEE